MCSLFGSFSRSMFDVLYEVNKDRGKFAFSSCFVGNKLMVHKFEGHPKDVSIAESAPDDIYFLGHTQAPTGSTRDWAASTSHPFEIGNWMVAHNGVITNFKELNNRYCPGNRCIVDSSVIPAMLNGANNEFPSFSAEQCIQMVLNRVEGTFSLWMIDRRERRIFLARQGSTLFANMSSGDFSSISGKKDAWTELKEGVIYEIRLDSKRISEAGSFKSKSPFLSI